MSDKHRRGRDRQTSRRCELFGDTDSCARRDLRDRSSRFPQSARRRRSRARSHRSDETATVVCRPCKISRGEMRFFDHLSWRAQFRCQAFRRCGPWNSIQSCRRGACTIFMRGTRRTLRHLRLPRSAILSFNRQTQPSLPRVDGFDLRSSNPGAHRNWANGNGEALRCCAV